MNPVSQEAIHSDMHGNESNRKPIFKVKISDMMMAGPQVVNEETSVQ